MLLIYTHKITSRFRYTMHHIFGELLGIEHTFTTKVEDFIKHSGAKITYTKQPLQKELFIRSNDLLFEQGINDIQIKVSDWEGVPCYFATGEESSIPFDIFSASFYLLSRYEEYLPHVKDDLGRFPSKTSWLFREGLIKRPLVDIWAHKFLKILQERFPELKREPRKYRFAPLINVTVSHAFAYKGFIRNIGGVFLDLTRLRLRRLAKRIKTWFNPKKDPYDNFDLLMQLHKRFKIKGHFFFQFAKYGHHDKNVSIYKNKFRYLIKWVGDYSLVSLSASFQSALDLSILKDEKNGLSSLINRPVEAVRLRYNKVAIPISYRNLVSAEFKDEYSMGYSHTIGFRAGTCTPFYFYDINLEMQQPLRVHPFVMYDYSLLKLKKQQEVFDELDEIYKEVKTLNGTLTMVFSNELFGSKHNFHWLELYENLLKRYYV
ncbi:polysaccharide deacetylase family protein [Croceivirga thetidis]|uniref:DUF7033 domain-containing protein n=1 Tax=Croceivirga thetidis TaxID=2721623 RepID=A0ABX1GTF5_9FLAO|nr:polysaccharide deacetylase family protein [Croceivirga thetidis]NKI33247.1 hypothetical protein [Croceivirga thetidis]